MAEVNKSGKSVMVALSIYEEIHLTVEWMKNCCLVV